MIFDETPLENQDFWDLPITDKWVPVAVESPDVITEEDRFDMLFSLDSVFRYWGSGNDKKFEDELKQITGVSEDGEVIPWDYCDTDVFKVQLFSSAYINGPHAFFNYRTGKVSGCFSIGKWPEKVGTSREELEFVARKWPKYKFFVTFFDNIYTDKTYECKPLCTLLIHNGSIQRVKTRTVNETRYTELSDYTYGSTGCRHHPFLLRYIDNRDNKISDVLSWIYLHVPGFIHRWLIGYNNPWEYQGEQYFSKEEAFELCKKWREKNGKLQLRGNQ